MRLGCGIAAEEVTAVRRWLSAPGITDPQGLWVREDFSRPPPAMCFEVLKDSVLYPCISFDDNGEEG